ncbi:sedoheptulokinase [Dysgonomonas termitidis]|uniref:Sedoheptulokinase n=1 Tax=Dysgonomonas termitidis TaxID=1516126 RepID=A0ABV9KUT4_9BACT
MQTKPCIVGIDFGTTSLSAVIVNVRNLTIEKVFSYNTHAYISFSDANRKEQSVEKLRDLFNKLLDKIQSYPDIKIIAYGFTGQMHGIIGVNNKKEAVTNLVTWQDKSGELVMPGGKKILEEMKGFTGADESIASGYGAVTLYKWLKYDGREDIDSFCTVADYFARQLAGSNENEEVKMSPTMAHSIGLFDVFTNSWRESSVQKLEIDNLSFPKIVSNNTIIGYTNSKPDTIPVVCAIGDNQASFMGSVVNDTESILLNVGTGTQLSFLIAKDDLNTFAKYIDGYETQIRPFDDKSYLVATSFINGGSVYESLFSFFKETGKKLFGLTEIDDNMLWQRMLEAGRDNCTKKIPLEVSPLLEGQRKNEGVKGCISDLTTANFTPDDFVAGFLKGLSVHYKTGYFPELESRVRYICGSGNGVKRNPLLCEMIEKEFGHPLYFSSYNEEAAMGAVVNAAKAIGVIKSEEESCSFLNGLSEKKYNTVM